MVDYVYNVIFEPDEDGYHAFVPSLPGCHSFGLTMNEAEGNIYEAIQLHIEGMLKDGETVPVDKEPLRVERMDVVAV